jgi:hypothetical protein
LVRSVNRVTCLFLLSVLIFGTSLTTQVHLSAGQKTDSVSRTPQKNVWDGVYTEAQAARGWVIYRENCGHCHRDNLLGDEGPPLSGVNFNYGWDNMTVAKLFDKIATTMPPPTGALVRSLSAQEYVDIIGFIFRSNELPAGTVELSSDRGALDQILFTRVPPGQTRSGLFTRARQERRCVDCAEVR